MKTSKVQHKLRSLAAIITAVFLVVMMAAPSAAFAYYSDIADSYGSIDDVASKGNRIDASEVPDGTYRNIEVRTSSKYCKVYACTLLKKGGELIATFTLSTSYSAIYLGTSDEAAAQTDADGLDDSAYILGEKVAVGAGKQMQFTIALSALNAPLDIATFNGGKTDIEEASWYSRSFVFDSSDEVNLAVSSGKGPQEAAESSSKEKEKAEKEEKDGGKTSSQTEETAKKDSEKDKQIDSKKAEKKDSEKSEKKESSKKKKQDEEKEPVKAAAAAASGKPSAGSRNGGATSSANEQKEADEEEGKQANAAVTEKSNAIPAVELSFVSAGIDPDEDAQVGEAAEAKDAGEKGPSTALLAVGGITTVLMSAGVALNILMFKLAGGILGAV